MGVFLNLVMKFDMFWITIKEKKNTQKNNIYDYRTTQFDTNNYQIGEFPGELVDIDHYIVHRNLSAASEILVAMQLWK